MRYANRAFLGVVLAVLAASSLAACDGNGENITCRMTFTSTGITVAVQDAVDGLKSIVNGPGTFNATVTIPSFPLNTTSPVTVTAKSKTTSASSILVLTVTDKFNGQKVCDPTLATVTAGRTGRVTLRHVPDTEHAVTIQNGSPGLRQLVLTVNSKRFHVKLNGQRKVNVDVGSAINGGSTNTVHVDGIGGAKSSATLLLWDGVTNPTRGPQLNPFNLLKAIKLP